MTRTEENEELTKKIQKATEDFAKSPLMTSSNLDLLVKTNMVAFLTDISKSLAIIADELKGGDDK